MTIIAKQISDLRAKTGAGMMDCKKALIETNGDFDAAVDWLRKKGVAAAAKKSANTAAEGLVAAKTSGKVGVVVELNSQTDFVARNDKFQALVATTADMALAGNDTVDALLNATYPGSSHILKDQITESIAVIGENMNLRRVAKLSVANGVVVSYVHNEVVPGLGKIAVLVALESSANADKLTPVARQIAMHVAAAKPESLDISSVDSSALEREKAIFADQAKASGKPESIIEKMVEGRVRKYYEEIVLLEQVFVIDGKTKISEVIANLAKECGTDVKLVGFTRFALGEGIEQTTSNFADEVKAAAGL